MNKQTLSLALSLTAVFGMALSAVAAPVEIADQANGVLSSPMTQAPNEDPVIQQAVKWIHSKRALSDHFVKVMPKNLSAHRDLDHALIMGYPDTVPM